MISMSVLIYCLYGVLLFSAVLMVLCINPIHSVLFFIIIFFCASFLFTLLHIDFMGLIFLMVYVGAIAVLFIFVVMMLNIKRIERDNTTYLLIGGFICILFFIQLMYIWLSALNLRTTTHLLFCDALLFDYLTNNDELVTKYFVQLLGMLLFSQYSVVLIFSGITLLIALIGSIFLTNTTSGYSVRRQDNQLSRNNKLFNVHIY